jgi:hypothetical protein
MGNRQIREVQVLHAVNAASYDSKVKTAGTSADTSLSGVPRRFSNSLKQGDPQPLLLVQQIASHKQSSACQRLVTTIPTNHDSNVETAGTL